MSNNDLEIKLTCSQCGKEVKCTSLKQKSTNVVSAIISPCTSCMDDVSEKAYNDGIDAANEANF